MTKPCHMCGAPGTKRITPDPDIEGIPLCDESQCRDLLNLFLLNPAHIGLQRSLERRRKKLHADKGTTYTKA